MTDHVTFVDSKSKMEDIVVNIERNLAKNIALMPRPPLGKNNRSQPTVRNRSAKPLVPTSPLNYKQFHFDSSAPHCNKQGNSYNSLNNNIPSLPSNCLKGRPLRVQSAHIIGSSNNVSKVAKQDARACTIKHQNDQVSFARGLAPMARKVCLENQICCKGTDIQAGTQGSSICEKTNSNTVCLTPDGNLSADINLKDVKNDLEVKSQKSSQVKSIKKRPFSAPAKGSCNVLDYNEVYKALPEHQNPKPKPFLKPVVVSCKTGEQICGPDPCEVKVTEGHQYPQKWEELETMCIEDLIDYDEDVEENMWTRLVPRTLLTILPWLTEDIPKAWTGVDSSQCLIFLPSMDQDPGGLEQLPVVPAPQAPNEELHYIEKLPPPKPPPVPKKYDHPWTPFLIEDWKCQHHTKSSEVKGSQYEHLRYFSKTGNLLMETPRGGRTSQVVRQEISELENLMNGVGRDDGCSLIVRYQADINRLQGMMDDTLPRLQEIERREAEKLAKESSNHFGLEAFYEEHDAVMEQIKQRHLECVRELASLKPDLMGSLSLGNQEEYLPEKQCNVEEKQS